MPVTVHYLNDSRAQRIIWLLEELGVEYTIKTYPRDPSTRRAPRELYEINPLGKSPVIQDGDNGEIVLAESGAIVEYLVGKYGNGKFNPPSGPGELTNLYYSHYAEGSLAPLLTNKALFDIVPTQLPFFIRPFGWLIFGTLQRVYLYPEIKRNLKMVEDHLAKSSSTWLAGGPEPTTADFQMGFPLEAIVAVAPDLVGPKVTSYVKNIHQREAYKRALEKGGEYKYGPKSE